MTVSNKLYTGFAVVIALILAMTLAQVRQARLIDAELDRLYERGVVGAEALGEATEKLQSIRALTFHHVATRDSDVETRLELQIETEEKELLEALDRVDAVLPVEDGRRGKLQRIREDYQQLAQRRGEEVLSVSRTRSATPPIAPTQAEEDSTAAALRAMEERTGPLMQQVGASLEELIKAHVGFNRKTYEDAREALAQSTAVVVLGSILATVVALVVALLLSRSISTRLRHLTRTAKEISAGELTLRAAAAGEDDIAHLARAFNDMTGELARRVEEQHAQAAEQESERQKLATAVASYASIVERVARGDLTAQVTVVGDAGMANLGTNLDVMVKALRTMTLRTHEAVGALTTATAEILTTVQEHATSANESASAVAETVATVDEVTQSARRVADEAGSVVEGARQTLEESSVGRQAVDRSVDAMNDVRRQMDSIGERILALSEQTQAVGQIITTVNELAEQSNMLALNASIEAARAGEEGRGFAIVAQEIRSLADQSKDATAQVRRILGEIQRSTGEAVLVTEQGAKAVRGAVDAVTDVGEKITILSDTLAESADAAEHILTASEQQVLGVGQISQAMQSINEASRQTVDGTRQIDGAARDLSRLSGDLRDAAAQYRT